MCIRDRFVGAKPAQELDGRHLFGGGNLLFAHSGHGDAPSFVLDYRCPEDLGLDVYKRQLQDPVLRLGAGDQGVMFGYACSETPQMLPLPVVLAHRLAGCLTTARKSGMVRGLRPDGKAQVLSLIHI